MQETSDGCRSCRFWDQRSKVRTEEGYCRRNAPVPFLGYDEKILEALGLIMWATYVAAGINEEDREENSERLGSESDQSSAFWPRTREEDWCGEYVDKFAA